MVVRDSIYRLRQFLRALEEQRAPVERGFVEAYLDERGRRLFYAMPPRDRVHAARTARLLLHAEGSDRDLVIAGLLHDVGKGEQQLWHRAGYVLLNATAPALLQRIARPGGDWRGAICRLRDHARRGAEMARSLGYGENVYRLIARHHSAANDARQQALQRAD